MKGRVDLDNRCFTSHLYIDRCIARSVCGQVNDIRKMIDKIAVDVDEVKKKHSAILSAPQTEDSQYLFNDNIISCSD